MYISKWHHFSAPSDFGCFSCVGYLKVQGNIYDQYHYETISVCLKFAVNFRCSYTVLGSGKVSTGLISGEKSKQILLKAWLDLHYWTAPSKIIRWFHLKISWPSFLSRPLPFFEKCLSGSRSQKTKDVAAYLEYEMSSLITPLTPGLCQPDRAYP